MCKINRFTSACRSGRVVANCVAACLGLAASASASAQWTAFDQLPGADKVSQAQGAFRGVAGKGIVADVRWSEDESTLYFQKDGVWMRVDLATGGTSGVNADDVPSAPKADRPNRRRRGGGGGGPPARGRQRASEVSPDGAWTLSTDGANVSLTPKARGDDPPPPIKLTTDGGNGLKYGTASWVYGEELDQHGAMWWSPDSKALAYYSFDERAVPAYFTLGGYTRLRTRVEEERYPKPGDPNPIPAIRMHRLLEDGTVSPAIDVDLGGADHYIYGIEFTPDSRELLVHRLNRHQDHLELLAVDAATGSVRTVVEEKQPCYQHHLPLMRFLDDGRRFVWETERSGYAQYELRSLDNSAAIPLSEGAFPVAGIVELNDDRGDLFYTANASATLINPQLFRVGLDGKGRVRVTPDDRHYSGFRVSPTGGFVVAVDQTLAEPPSTGVYVVPAAGSPTPSAASTPRPAVATLAAGDTDPYTIRGATPPQLLTLTAADGTTTLYGKLFRPSGFDPATEYPIVVRVYGGPVFRTVENTFDPNDPLTELGFVVMQVDNRGTPGRGKAFEDGTYLKLGIVDMDDQAAAVKQVDVMPGMDGTRVGMTGSSYGGYLAVLALLRYPDTFHAAVADAAVTDWRNYDTIYTERYMRTPEENTEGYDAGSCVKLADRLQGDLLILHNMADDNVHPSNAFQLAQELQGLNKSFSMMLFPTGGHGAGGPSAQSIEWSWLVKHLIEEPAAAAREREANQP
ncbi:MAG: DPP IV N-terminal domain-containing protein [Planctomycetota bacterium]|nr:DPP IV N-terminal domain-containing protein [Planctomycetota bacterium]MDA1105308.1 DPP IV N-terminal domain-containing protein [Planctomycetota bacterium]